MGEHEVTPIALDPGGRIQAFRLASVDAAGHAWLATHLGALVGAALVPLGWSATGVGEAHVAVVSFVDASAQRQRVLAGTAVRDQEATAFRDAAVDAVLASPDATVLTVGVAHMIERRAARAALILGTDGDVEIGTNADVSWMHALAATDGADIRIAVGTASGDFRLLDLGTAKVVLTLERKVAAFKCVDHWFDALVAARAAAHPSECGPAGIDVEAR
jgi:hypothetical protein